jgi:hypothetical protein
MKMWKCGRVGVVPIVFVLAMVFAVPLMGAANLHSNAGHELIPNSCVMQQIGSKWHGYSSGNSLQGDVWLQEGFSGGVSCLTFQPASRINNRNFDDGETVVHWRIALYNSANQYITSYVWDGAANSPQPDAPSWYFYGPIITLSCATGQIHATFDVNEGSGAAEFGDNNTDGDQIHTNSANLWTC